MPLRPDRSADTTYHRPASPISCPPVISNLGRHDMAPVRPTQHERVESAWAAHVSLHRELVGATLVRKQDEDSGDAPLQTHRIYRSTEGAYYLFICTAGQPGYLTQLTTERVKNALRSTPEIFAKEFGCD